MSAFDFLNSLSNETNRKGSTGSRKNYDLKTFSNYRISFGMELLQKIGWTSERKVFIGVSPVDNSVWIASTAMDDSKGRPINKDYSFNNENLCHVLGATEDTGVIYKSVEEKQDEDGNIIAVRLELDTPYNITRRGTVEEDVEENTSSLNVENL